MENGAENGAAPLEDAAEPNSNAMGSCSDVSQIAPKQHRTAVDALTTQGQPTGTLGSSRGSRYSAVLAVRLI